MYRQYQVAAEWWADKIRTGRNSGLSADERRRPENLAYQMAEMLMDVRPPVTDEQISVFIGAVIRGLESGDAHRRRIIGVDYHPDPILNDALVEAKIDNMIGVLPIKTTMWLNDDGSVDVCYGYAAEVQRIYAVS